jgi:hypothetical protein
MRTKEIDMGELKSLQEVYEFLELHVYDLERKMDITELFVKFRDQTENETEKKLAQWDLECFLFNFFGGSVFSFSYASSGEGHEIHRYPHMDKWQTDAFDHVKQRAETVRNPLLKATYNHLLWKAPKGVKHTKYAIIAVESYYVLIEHYIELFNKDKNENNFFEITRKFKNMVVLATETKHYVTELNKLAHRLLFDVTALKFYHKESILKTMLDSPAIFKKPSFFDTLGIFENALKDLTERTEFSVMAEDLKTALRIASKIGQDSRVWHNAIGECFVSWAAIETDDERAWIKQSILTEAIHAFMQAGNGKRKQEVEVLHDKTRDKAYLQGGSFPYDPKVIAALKVWDKEIQETTTEILKEAEEVIYSHLASAKIFPTKEFLKKTAFKQEAWLEGINVIKFDINKNIQSLRNREDNSEEGFWESYQFQLKHTILPYLHYLFIPGIKSGKLGYLGMIEYFAKHTWIGQTFTKFDLAGKSIQYNWLGVIAPSIIEYYTQMQAALLDETYRSSYVLCVDSLTMKMEGLLRDFAQKLNTSTSKASQTGMQVKFIQDLLKDETIKRNFSDEDQIFFDFLFVNKGGVDLRNNIAHCFYDYQDYGFDQMHLLLVALLRIGRYRFAPLTNEKKK